MFFLIQGESICKERVSKGSKPCKYSCFLGSISLFLNAPCHGGQVSKQAMDGLPEKTERYSQENRTFSGTTI